jgi:hypothetical protein
VLRIRIFWILDKAKTFLANFECCRVVSSGSRVASRLRLIPGCILRATRNAVKTEEEFESLIMQSCVLFWKRSLRRDLCSLEGRGRYIRRVGMRTERHTYLVGAPAFTCLWVRRVESWQSTATCRFHWGSARCTSLMGRALAQYFPVRFRPSGWGGLLFFGASNRLTLTLVSWFACYVYKLPKM